MEITVIDIDTSQAGSQWQTINLRKGLFEQMQLRITNKTIGIILVNDTVYVNNNRSGIKDLFEFAVSARLHVSF